MRINNLLIVCSILILLSSCQIGRTSGIEYLSDKQKKDFLQKTDQPISQLESNGKLYIVKDQQIRDFLNEKDSVVIYHWSPLCPSIISIKEFVEYCQLYNLQGLCILDFITKKAFPSIKDCGIPLFFYDLDDYNTNKEEEYISEFQKRIIGQEVYGRFLLFFNGKFVRSVDYIFDKKES